MREHMHTQSTYMHWNENENQFAACNSSADTQAGMRTRGRLYVWQAVDCIFHSQGKMTEHCLIWPASPGNRCKLKKVSCAIIPDWPVHWAYQGRVKIPISGRNRNQGTISTFPPQQTRRHRRRETAVSCSKQDRIS